MSDLACDTCGRLSYRKRLQVPPSITSSETESACILEGSDGCLEAAVSRLRAQLAAVTRERDEALAWQKVKQEWIDVAARTLQANSAARAERDALLTDAREAATGLMRKLATAVEALEWYANMHAEGTRYLRAGDAARKALAAIRGTETKT